jgi:tetratricopeptide (TPR) repeat protein
LTAKAADRAKIAATAEKYVKAGKLIAAIVEYEKLLDGSPHDLPISNIIGDLHLRHGDDDKAIRIFTANVEALERRGAYAQALAIAKKIQKIRPHDFENIIRMGDLYGSLGFVPEARAEYFRAGEELQRRREHGPLQALYEKLARIDRTDLDTRLKLARLYVKKLQMDRAVTELNDVADLLYVRNEPDEAEKILREALAIQDDNVRTMSNLVRVLAAAGKNEAAIAQVEKNVSRHGERPELLGILANLHLEADDQEKAAEVFDRILAEDPDNADARAKLGLIEIRRGRLDEAYKIFEPLLLSLLHKNKEEKAVGLLGLILMTGTMHLPSLERLATIFRIGGRRPELEVVDRVLLAEYRDRRQDDDRSRVVKELAELSPFDPKIEREFKALHWEAKVFSEEPAVQDSIPGRRLAAEGAGLPSVTEPPLSEEERDIIRLNLAKADDYISQGLVRNARRILDNLLLLYPDNSRILAKMAELGEMKPVAGKDEIELLIERIVSGAEAAAPDERVLPPVDLGEREAAKVTTAELFAGLDLVPFVAPPSPPPAAFLDLGAKIEEELEAVEAAFFKQIKDRTQVIEKDLAEIVQEFRRQVETKLDKQNTEVRYDLGLAFLEQGLWDEAVEEFKLAAADPEREVDCYGLIARAFVLKKNYPEAERWLQQALDRAPPGSTAHYALTYEMASLYEAMNQNERALALFREVKGWDAKYREVAKRTRILEKIVSAG